MTELTKEEVDKIEVRLTASHRMTSLEANFIFTLRKAWADRDAARGNVLTGMKVADHQEGEIEHLSAEVNMLRTALNHSHHDTVDMQGERGEYKRSKDALDKLEGMANKYTLILGRTKNGNIVLLTDTDGETGFEVFAPTLLEAIEKARVSE
jgi:hypothetical protein